MCNAERWDKNGTNLIKNKENQLFRGPIAILKKFLNYAGLQNRRGHEAENWLPFSYIFFCAMSKNDIHF